jgi:hypothetical protein
MPGTTGAFSKSGSSGAILNKHVAQGMLGERTNEFQFLKLEREE